jgi:hypothetical protein
MILFFLGFLTFLGAFFRSRYNLGLEILALRQQLGVAQTKNSSPSAANPGSNILDSAPPPLACMEPDAHHCETRNRGRPASRRLSFVLALPLSGKESWQAKDRCRASISDPEDGQRGCFCNLLLVTRLQLRFPKALALHCGLTRIGEAKFGFNPTLPV